MLTYDSIHSTRQHWSEMENNIRLLRIACITTEATDFHPNMASFKHDIQQTKRLSSNRKTDNKHSSNVKVYRCDEGGENLREFGIFLNTVNIEIFHHCYVSTIKSNEWLVLKKKRLKTISRLTRFD